MRLPKPWAAVSAAPSIAPADWLPQGFGGTARKVVDPIVEPLWEGRRLLVRIGIGSADAIDIVDDKGQRLTDLDEIEAGIAAATRATGLVLDGYLTGQATQQASVVAAAGAVGADILGPADMVTQLFIGSTGRDRRMEASRQRALAAAAGPLAFVAVDLLAVDGQPLLDAPLLERKRLLEGCLDEGDFVRRTIFVRPPVGSWLATWRNLGFAAMAWKAANSRYAPGQRTREWAIARIPRR